MPDQFTKKKRSEVMRAVRSAGNETTEIKLISLFRQHRISGWRRNYPLFGKPDFVFPKRRIVVFADGCFWHGHHCRNLTPKQNAIFWRHKFARNKKRDALVRRTLFKNGWVVVRLWECHITEGRISKFMEVFKIRKRGK